MIEIRRKWMLMKEDGYRIYGEKEALFQKFYSQMGPMGRMEVLIIKKDGSDCWLP